MRKLGTVLTICATAAALFTREATAQNPSVPEDPDTAAIAAVQARLRSNLPIVIVDREGRQHDGFVQRSSLSTVSIAANGQTYDLQFRDIGRIQKRGDPLWNGALIGVVASAPYWVLATAFSCDGRGADCATATGIGTAGIFAALGAYIDSRKRGRTLIYGPGRQEGVNSLSDLWMSVESGDRITLTTTQGASTSGVFQRMTNGSVTMLVEGQIRTFAEPDVRRLVRRGDSLENGTLIGVALGALAFVAPCDEDVPSSDCLSAGGRVAAGSFTALVFGALGALIDSLIVGHTDVYESAPKRVTFQVDPDLARGHRGVLVSIGF